MWNYMVINLVLKQPLGSIFLSYFYIIAIIVAALYCYIAKYHQQDHGRISTIFALSANMGTTVQKLSVYYSMDY
jgi:hypothetical protein